MFVCSFETLAFCCLYFFRALGSAGSFFVTYIVAQMVFLVAQCLMHCWCWPATESWQRWCFVNDYHFVPVPLGRGLGACFFVFFCLWL